MRKIHRLEWERVHETIPTGLFVCHHCDNPGCYRIEHLYLADAATNNRDARLRGRANWAKGSSHGLSKLTPRQVHSIRRGLLNKVPKMTLAKK